MQKSLEDRIVIVGAGQAGGWVATTLRAEGHRGEIILVGDETHPPYERPPLSKSFLQDQSTLEEAFIKKPSFYDDQRITLRLGCPVDHLDRSKKTIVCGDGGALSYDRLVLTMGARPRRLRLPGADSERVHYLRNAQDAERLKRLMKASSRLAIIGGGFIGMEIAASAAVMGLAVVVIESAPVLMGRVLPRQVSSYLETVHMGQGVEILKGRHVAGFRDGDAEIAIVLEDGATVTADHVVVGIGAIPNTELATAAGIVADNGIRVDEHGVTNDASISAAGDVTNHYNPFLGTHVRLETWQNAQNQAIAVASNMVHGGRPYAETPWFWTDQYDVNVQMAGAAVDWNRVDCRVIGEAHQFSVVAIDGGVVTAAVTVNQPREMRAAKRLIAGRTPVDPRRLAEHATLASLLQVLA